MTTDGSHRLHAGAARRSDEADVKLTRPARSSRRRSSARPKGPLAAFRSSGGDQLATAARSIPRRRYLLRALVHLARPVGLHAAAQQGVLGPPLRARQRASRASATSPARARTPAPMRRRRPAARRAEAGGRRRVAAARQPEPAGLPLSQAALRTDHGDRHDARRVSLAGRARRDAGLVRNHPALKGLNDSAHGTGGRRRRAGRPRRSSSPASRRRRRLPSAARARCCAPTTRRRARKSARCTCRRSRADRR